MKSYLFKISLSLLLILVASFSFCQVAEDIKFENQVKKFNRTDEGKLVELTYSFSYKGTVKLSIIPPKVDCSCTEVILPKSDIEPNSNNIIIIRFNTKDKIGYQQREVILNFVSDAMDSRSIEKKLVFKGVVNASKETKDIYKQNK